MMIWTAYSFRNTLYLYKYKLEIDQKLNALLPALCRCFDGNSEIRGYVDEQQQEKEVVLFGVCTLTHTHTPKHAACALYSVHSYYIQNQMKNQFVEHWHDVCLCALCAFAFRFCVTL